MLLFSCVIITLEAAALHVQIHLMHSAPLAAWSSNSVDFFIGHAGLIQLQIQEVCQNWADLKMNLIVFQQCWYADTTVMSLGLSCRDVWRMRFQLWTIPMARLDWFPGRWGDSVAVIWHASASEWRYRQSLCLNEDNEVDNYHRTIERSNQNSRNSLVIFESRLQEE